MTSKLSKEIILKLNRLKQILKKTEGCAVAFSGGVDSSIVLTVAHEVLGERCLAVIATSSTYPEKEFSRAVEWVKSHNIPYTVISSEELDIKGFSDNPTDRCYYCKSELFNKVWEQATIHGLKCVADGTNADDTGDYRPGMNAACELGVLSPLMEAGLTKEEIRILAREVYNLPMADKPSMACLASRFPYGSKISKDKLTQVEKIEDFLEQEGFRIFRARHHGDIVRIELGQDEMNTAIKEDIRRKISAFAKAQGFTYITLDLEGYRTGSMNERLIAERNITNA